MGNVIDTRTLLTTGALIGLTALTAGAAAPAAAGAAAAAEGAAAATTGAAALGAGTTSATTANLITNASSITAGLNNAFATGTAATTASTVAAAAETATWKSTLANLLKAGATGINIGGSLQARDEQNELLKTQFLQDEYNSKMEHAQNELDLAIKEKETQQQLAATLATQNNMFGAVGINPANGGSAGQVMQSTLAKGQEDDRFMSSMNDIARANYNTSRTYRQQAYRAAKRNTSAKAGASAVGSLIQFGASMYGS